VYVSRATLVVVPPTLVGHWTHQIAAHTAPGAPTIAPLLSVMKQKECSRLQDCWWHVVEQRPIVLKPADRSFARDPEVIIVSVKLLYTKLP